MTAILCIVWVGLAAASPPGGPALADLERRLGQAGDAWGRCIGAAAQAKAGSAGPSEAVADAALASCPAEEAALGAAWRDYYAALGAAPTDAQLRELMAAAREAARPRLLGCINAGRVGDGAAPVRC